MLLELFNLVHELVTIRVMVPNLMSSFFDFLDHPEQNIVFPVWKGPWESDHLLIDFFNWHFVFYCLQVVIDRLDIKLSKIIFFLIRYFWVLLFLNVGVWGWIIQTVNWRWVVPSHSCRKFAYIAIYFFPDLPFLSLNVYEINLCAWIGNVASYCDWVE